MSREAIYFILSLVIAALILIILYQQFIYRKGLRRSLEEITGKLEEILDNDSDEKLLFFTDNQALIHLNAQINRLLEKHHKIRADYHRSEIASRKMLSNISHDIRTPMTVILGYLEIIRLNGAGSDEMLGRVEQKAQKVMELMDEFFTLARLEAGDTDIELAKLNINECCRENVLDFYEMLTRREFQVEVDIPEETVYIMGNRDAVQRILFNLITNALRYGSEGKYLGIFLRWDEENVYLDVTDRGKGIEKAFAMTVFDRLFTMEDSRNREIQGNGLGLTIARNLARQMGGDILLDSEPNVSTTFTVRLKKYVLPL